MTKVNSLNNDSSTFTVDNTLTVTLGNAIVTAGDVLARNVQGMKFTGFSAWAGGSTTPFFDDTTLGSFTVNHTGTGYIKGALVSWTGPQTVTG